MSKHTPGPWNWQLPISRNLANCLSGGGGRPLLRCIDVSEADAHLIAAAPELLEACKTLVALPGTEDWAATLRLAVEQARAAIAKAEGA